MNCAGMPERRRRSSTSGLQSLRPTYRIRRMLSLSEVVGIHSSATRTGHASQPQSRMYNCETGMINPASGLFSALAVCD